MKKTLTIMTIMSVFAFGTMSANAAMPEQANPNGKFMPPPPPPGHEMMHKPLTAEQKAEMEKRKAEMDKQLGITDAQKAQLKAIHEKSRAQIAPKIKVLTEYEYELSILEKRKMNKEVFGINTLENVKLSGKSADQLRKEIWKLKSEINEIKKAQFEASQAVFTDAQKKQLEKMRQDKMKQIKKDKKHHEGHHGPAHPGFYPPENNEYPNNINK